MTNFMINFSRPWLLLLLIPAVALSLYTYFRVNKKYRRNRNRIISVTLHTLVMLLCITLLSGITFSYDVPNTENEILILVDSSYSNKDEQVKKDDFVQSLINSCGGGFKVGIVKFGYDQVYAAPLTDNLRGLYDKYIFSDDPDTSATNVTAALRYASEQFAKPQTAKIVIVSDGIETDENALGYIKSLAAQGIKVDALHMPNEEQTEIQITGVDLPDYNVDVGVPFPIKLNVQNNLKTAGSASVTVYDRLYGGEEVADEPVRFDITENLQKFELRHTVYLPGLHELRFEIQTAENVDTIVQNNVYYSYIYVNEFNKILILENVTGESDNLNEKLAESSYEVTTISIWNEEDADAVPKDIAELCDYEQVILVNISNADLTNTYTDYDGEVIPDKKNILPEGFENILYNYVYVQGGGLFTVGGENDVDPVTGRQVSHSYNRDDMAGSLYQQMLPVQVVNYTPPVAVMLIIDHSGSMGSGPSSALGMAKKGARNCVEFLNTRDYCGVMTLDTDAYEILPITPVSKRQTILDAIENISDNGDNGTVFAKAIEDAGSMLNTVNVEKRHIILVTDGVPSDISAFLKAVEYNTQNGITMSIVGCMGYGLSDLQGMKDAADRGNGEFYNCKTTEEIAEAMKKDLETEAVAEINYGEPFTPVIKDHTSAVAGIENAKFPQLTGYYGTREKQGAEIPLIGEYVPLYAQWKFGNGMVGSFMCDLNERWSQGFLSDPTGERFLNNVIESLFPVQDIKPKDIRVVTREDNFTTQFNIFTQLNEGERVELTVEPVSDGAKDYYSDKAIPVTVTDGFKRFEVFITCAGLYEIRIDKKTADGTVLSSIVEYKIFSYSQEYNYFPDRQPIGQEFLEKIALDGRGILIDDVAQVFDSFEKTLHVIYDPRLLFLILASIFFLLDIAVRKFKFKWLHELIKDHKQAKLLK